jgi:hypothetical protein
VRPKTNALGNSAMTITAKAQEPSMEEILASIRRIIADDDASKSVSPPPEPVALKPAPIPPPVAVAPVRPVTPPPAPPPRAPVAPPPKPVANNQQEIDAMLAEFEPAKATPPKPAPKPPAPPADVLDLTEAMAAPAPSPSPGPVPSFRTIDGASDVVFADRTADPEPSPVRVPEEPRRTFAPNPAPASTLLSTSATAAVDHAFNTLAQTMLVNNARTLEDLVKEMLRPMLKAWLDDNLPGLVERIVRAEIERVARGRP